MGLAFSVRRCRFAINHLLNIRQSMTGMSGNISRIPLWLAAASLAFARVHQHGGRFLPALRAMKAGAQPAAIGTNKRLKKYLHFPSESVILYTERVDWRKS